MNRKIIATLVLVLLISGGTLLAQRQSTPHDNNKLQVVTSFYPLQDIAQHIGGNKVQVTSMTPSGAEPHDFEPAAKSIADAQNAPLFVYNGLKFEPWVEAFLKDYQYTAVRASSGLEVTEDPHFWLDPVLAQGIAANIRDGLIKADPSNQAYYTNQAKEYIVQLQQLDADFAKGLAQCTLRTIVVSHDAFAYPAKRYNITVKPIAGLSPEDEPSPAQLAEVSQFVKANNVTYIFFESLASPRLTDTIATETGAQTLVLDPIEGLNDEAQQQGKDYLSLQHENLANLRRALACQ